MEPVAQQVQSGGQALAEPATGADVPTIAESGYPEYYVSVWNGVAVPAHVPDDVARILTDSLDRMMNDADSHADEDKKRRELVEIKNQADTQAHGLEKLLKELGMSTDDIHLLQRPPARAASSFHSVPPAEPGATLSDAPSRIGSPRG